MANTESILLNCFTFSRLIVGYEEITSFLKVLCFKTVEHLSLVVVCAKGNPAQKL